MPTLVLVLLSNRLRDSAGIRVESIGKLHYRSSEDEAGFDQEHIPMHIYNGQGMVWGSVRNPLPSQQPRGGRMLGDLRLRRTYGIYVLAVHRDDRNITESTETLRLRFADTLLLEGETIVFLFKLKIFPLCREVSEITTPQIPKVVFAFLDVSDNFIFSISRNLLAF